MGITNATDRSIQLGLPVSRTDLLVQALKEAILDGSLAAGTPLSEREIGTRFGVSKTPVRDALRLLLATGLVEISSYQQVTVRTVDAALIRELYQARLVIEPEAVGMAVERRGALPLPSAHTALADAATADSTDDLASLGLANRSFHRELYAPCGNRFLIEQLDRAQDLTALAATVGWRKLRTNRQEACEHADILEAYERGNARAAVEALRRHIGAAAQHLESLVTG